MVRPGTSLRHHALKRLLNSELQGNTTVLDIGGYDGYIATKLIEADPNLQITVVDIDRAGLQSAVERGLNAVYGSVFALPFDDHYADVILLLDLLEHLDDDRGAVEEIARVLKPSGKAIITTPMKDGVPFPLLSKAKSQAINRSWGHVRAGYSVEDMGELIRETDLQVVQESRYFNFLTRLIYRFTVLSKLPVKGKGLLFRAVLRLEPCLTFGGKEHIFICKKSSLK